MGIHGGEWNHRTLPMMTLGQFSTIPALGLESRRIALLILGALENAQKVVISKSGRIGTFKFFEICFLSVVLPSGRIGQFWHRS